MHPHAHPSIFTSICINPTHACTEKAYLKVCRHHTLKSGCIYICMPAYACMCYHMHIYTHKNTWPCIYSKHIHMHTQCICIHVHHAYIYKHRHACGMCSYVHSLMHVHTHVASWYIYIYMPRLTCMHKHAFIWRIYRMFMYTSLYHCDSYRMLTFS